jgi:hypothetical protein
VHIFADLDSKRRSAFINIYIRVCSEEEKSFFANQLRDLKTFLHLENAKYFGRVAPKRKGRHQKSQFGLRKNKLMI